MTMLVDTHKAIKELTQAGAEERLAEAIVGAITAADKQVATKDDIQLLRAEIEQVRTEMGGMEERLTRRMYAVAFVVTSILVAVRLNRTCWY